MGISPAQFYNSRAFHVESADGEANEKELNATVITE